MRLFGSQAGGSNAVLGTVQWTGQPDFIAKGCRIAVARFIPAADAAMATGVGVSPSTSAVTQLPMPGGGSVFATAGQGSLLPGS